MEQCAKVCKNVNTLEHQFIVLPPLGDDDGGDDDGGRIFPEHPSPILHAPRDNISRKGNPSLRYIYIYIYIYTKYIGIYKKYKNIYIYI